MHLQTQLTQVFTVFGSYALEADADYFPPNNDQPDSQGRCDTAKIKLVDARPEAARHCQRYQYSMAA